MQCPDELKLKEQMLHIVASHHSGMLPVAEPVGNDYLCVRRLSNRRPSTALQSKDLMRLQTCNPCSRSVQNRVGHQYLYIRVFIRIRVYMD